MKLKTTIAFKGTLPEIVADLEHWKKQDPVRAKLLSKCPAVLKLTFANYPVKSERRATVAAQRTIWAEDADKLPNIIAQAVAE
jgi:hypothetical protein